MQAIQVATVTAAEALDLIAVAGVPLAHVSRLQSVAFVMKGGVVVTPCVTAGRAGTSKAERLSKCSKNSADGRLWICRCATRTSTQGT